VHDLKHTFGRRLRAAGVSFEDRQDLLGHRSGRITTHYSAAGLLGSLRLPIGWMMARLVSLSWWCCAAPCRGGPAKLPRGHFRRQRASP